MPFHHVRAGLLYTDNFLTTSLSEISEEQLAHISTEELDEIREAFQVLDRDGNGFISKQELGVAMRSLGYMPSEVELAIIMQRLDMDGDGQVDFDEFVTILGPKLLSSDTREGFLGSTIDSIFWQFDMQQMSLEELKQVLFHAFRDHLTMKDIENIIVNEEESLKDSSGNCQTEFEGVHSKGKNRQTCVRKSLICAFAMAFIISVMLIAANQMLRKDSIGNRRREEDATHQDLPSSLPFSDWTKAHFPFQFQRKTQHWDLWDYWRERPRNIKSLQHGPVTILSALYPRNTVKSLLLQGKTYTQTNDGEQFEKQMFELHQGREMVIKSMKQVVEKCTDSDEAMQEILHGRSQAYASREYKEVVEHYREKCFDWHEAKYQSSMDHLYLFANLLDKKVSVERIKNAIDEVGAAMRAEKEKESTMGQ
ncbi:hypothetical protein KOW79_015861 [Hemibagrus wyckioides]|uniref:EF-hand domain-containing protein n=1 Tax=Hemibagrus wyckioides TaxID=337641 RepID=A0A9D3NDL5_9TELE|nr:hypothetical protein KOW79_015861 [Hemibagrus wyckioides]